MFLLETFWQMQSEEMICNSIWHLETWIHEPSLSDWIAGITMANLKADLDDYLKGRQSQNFGGNLASLAKSFTLPALKFGSAQQNFDEESGNLDSASLISDKQVSFKEKLL